MCVEYEGTGENVFSLFEVLRFGLELILVVLYSMISDTVYQRCNSIIPETCLLESVYGENLGIQMEFWWEFWTLLLTTVV